MEHRTEPAPGPLGAANIALIQVFPLERGEGSDHGPPVGPTVVGKGLSPSGEATWRLGTVQGGGQSWGKSSCTRSVRGTESPSSPEVPEVPEEVREGQGRSSGRHSRRAPCQSFLGTASLHPNHPWESFLSPRFADLETGAQRGGVGSPRK